MGKAQSWLKPIKEEEKIIPRHTTNEISRKNKNVNTLIITAFCF